MKTLGQKIRELREEKDLSLREFAKKIGVSAAFLSDIELGRRYPSKKILPSISKNLGIDINDLSNYDTRPPIEDIKRLAMEDPGFAMAFRKVIDKKITSEELMDLLKGRSSKKKK
jgi:transcriptional regulator with XRE-family HTH domain